MRTEPMKTVDIPIELYESMNGRYFIGYADNLKIPRGKNAWARLYNPRGSGVNLHLNVWTVTDISAVPFRAQFWFNATPPLGLYSEALATSANTAYRPIPIPLVRLQFASGADGEPMGGIKAFVRRGEPYITLAETENGKLIFPPGGSFLVYLTLEGDTDGEGRVAFGWWEERI